MTPLTVCQHDGAAAILLNGQTTYCGEEERYLRYKHARGHIPVNAIAKSLEFNKIGIKDIKAVFISACKHPDLKKRVQVYFKHYFGHSPEVIMIDTMYKDRKKTALVKNNMRLVREIVGPDSDYVELLKVALNCAKNRVVLKQPRYADPIREIRKCSHQILGKSIRYDIFMTN